jgi:flagellar biogenesis protein FliO
LVRREPGDTLSENTRAWLGTDKTWKTWGALGFVIALVGFVVWFVPHIVFHAW